MKRVLMFGILMLFLVSFTSAIPNPSATYCVEMNYTYENETCFFNDGNSCEAWSFYDGSCGSDYVKEIECAEAGEGRGVAKICCEGLEALETSAPGEDGICATMTGSYGTCSDCGDSICEEWENKCNCPEDCEDEEETPTTKVCCHRFGYGNQMRKVNSKYQWVEKENCIVDTEESDKENSEIVNVKWCKVAAVVKARNRLRANIQAGECPEKCTCTGSTMKCELNGGREMTIRAGNSGNTIVQVKGVNMSTKVALYKEDNLVYGVFKNNQTRAIKVLPDEVREKIRQAIKEILEDEEIELDEDGLYQVQAKKRARLFFMFPVRERVRIHVDSETGDIIRTRTSWWGFLARDIKPKECTAEAKGCDDGTSVGRNPDLNCEFNPCPEETTE